jgi:hypothetical protein
MSYCHEARWSPTDAGLITFRGHKERLKLTPGAEILIAACKKQGV